MVMVIVGCNNSHAVYSPDRKPIVEMAAQGAPRKG